MVVNAVQLAAEKDTLPSSVKACRSPHGSKTVGLPDWPIRALQLERQTRRLEGGLEENNTSSTDLVLISVEL